MSARPWRALLLAAVAAVLCAGCATGPAPLDDVQMDEVLDGIGSLGSQPSTVGEALALAPSGTIQMIDARIATGVANEQVAFQGAPPEDLHNWMIVGVCGYPNAIPSIEIAAVPPEDIDAALANRNFHLVCDGA